MKEAFINKVEVRRNQSGHIEGVVINGHDFTGRATEINMVIDWRGTTTVTVELPNCEFLATETKGEENT